MINFLLIIIAIILSPVILFCALISVFIIYAVIVGMYEGIKKAIRGDKEK